jgi:hypothetical protein
MLGSTHRTDCLDSFSSARAICGIHQDIGDAQGALSRLQLIVSHQLCKVTYETETFDIAPAKKLIGLVTELSRVTRAQGHTSYSDLITAATDQIHTLTSMLM